ncbi:MAG: ribonuclease R, partial [Deinococcus sp.]|nr:ribonuclease R [Deinococcus sp.]
MPKTNPKSATSEEQVSEVAGTEQSAKPTRKPRKKAAGAADAGKAAPSSAPKKSAASKSAAGKKTAAKRTGNQDLGQGDSGQGAAEAPAQPAKPRRTSRRKATAQEAASGSEVPDLAPAATEQASSKKASARKAGTGKASAGQTGAGKAGQRRQATVQAAAPAEAAGADSIDAQLPGAPVEPAPSEPAPPAKRAKSATSTKAGGGTARRSAAKRNAAAPAEAAATADADPEPAGTEPQEQPTPERPAKPQRSPRRTARSKAVEMVSEADTVPAPEATAPEPAVALSSETPQPLADLPAVQGDTAGDAAAGQEQAAAEPLVLQRPKRGKRKTQPHEEVLDADLEQLSGVEPVAPQNGAPNDDVLGSDVSDGGAVSSDVLAALLPELPAVPPVSAPADAPEQLSDPVQELLVSQLRSIGRPIHVRDLEKSFTRQKARLVGSWRDIEGVLEDLTRAGLVVRTRKKTYGLPGAMNLVRGRFQASAAGFGFVVPDSGREDYYVPSESTLEAWNGDTVLVRPEGHGPRGGNSGRRGSRFDGNPQASVVRIVQRHYAQLVGTLEYSHGYPILKADDFRARHRILLLSEGLEELEAGARVVVDLYWPEDTGEDEVFGQVSRVLGEEDDPETETEAVMVKYGLRGEFPPEVLSEAGRIPAQIPETALRGRMDLRALNTFTVDGRDAKDFDDAIHIQPTEAGTFLVGVHIADVSHYVRAGSELDGEAYARATSVYLPGRVLPMLPEHLSNGVCSLVPREDRLTMSALVELSADAEILNVEIGPSVIHSKARLTYDEVQAYSEGTSPMPEHARHLEGDLHLLLKVTTKLRQQRLRDGSLDFKMREVKVDVDEDGRMELIPLREETARGMIEDLMLLANKVVAHFLLERGVPTLFRIHEEPTLQRFQDVSQAIGRLGLAFPGGEPTPQAYQDVLKQVRGTPRESVVNTLLLRSMQQAKYSGENLGHFGLAFDEYLHFTSPIRRYPDLMVHRVLRGVLGGELRPSSREVDGLRSVLPSMGEHTSDRERNAAEAERDLTKYYQAKWAQEHQGLSFMGSVSGVVASGLFVALDNGVEGKLHISNLDDDYYIYLEDAQMLKGRSSGRTFRLGDALAVTISEVKPLARQIDFTVPEEGTELEEIVMSENQPSGNKTQGPRQKAGGQKVRARRREDREQERQQKLSNVRPTQPRFTLEEDAGGRSRGPRTGGNSEGRSAQGGRPSREGDQGGSHRSRGGAQVNQGGGRRRVITLERPRNE